MDLQTLNKQKWLHSAETAAVFDALGDPDCARFGGGCVRNALLGLPVKDLDMATTLVPEVVVERLEAANLHAIPTGLDHGTITAVSGGVHYEITTLRKDVETTGRHAIIAYSTDWKEDAARRDFTMNALYADREGNIHDPLDGLEDLKARRVHFIGEAAERIAEDYLRILRFFRIHAWYGEGELEADGLAAAVAAKGHLHELSIERVRDELLKLLCARDPLPVLRTMSEVGILEEILPEALDLERLGNLARIDDMSKFVADAVLRFGAFVDGDAEAARGLAVRFRLSNDEQVRMKAMKTVLPHVASEMAHEDMRRAIYLHGTQSFTDALRLAWAAEGDDSKAVVWRTLLALAETWPVPQFPLSGKDVMALGVKAGPEVGRILKEVEAWWVGQDFVDGGLREELQRAAKAVDGGEQK